MEKYLTKYTINGDQYESEIFCNYNRPLALALATRKLPNEYVISKETDFSTHTESVAYYIEQGKYVDAIHRFLYMATIKGLDESFMQYVHDDGLIHKLTHVKTSFKLHSIQTMIDEANDFERCVPGSYLWATH